MMCEKSGDSNERGTEVTFYPDPEIFDVLEYNYDTLWLPG